MMRQPIVVLVGHIDHGKSSILEHIKNVSITKKEAGGITQSLHSYTIPLMRLEECCSALLKRNQMKITLPGLLFLDSPGHAAFNTMRKRGGSLADLAILVIDLTKGIEEQTKECMKILKQYKTPFIIALNKVDKIEGWKSHRESSLLESLSLQSEKTIEELEVRLYGVVEKLSQEGIQADRFDRIDDFTKTVAIVPVSAKTEDGLPELVMVLIGLAQKFLETSLKTKTGGSGKATILEVAEEPGIGTTLDVVVYEGSVKVNDQIVIGTLGEPLVTKVRAVFEPDEKEKKLKSVREVHAAAGVRVIAPELGGVIGGMPLQVVPKGGSLNDIKKSVQEETDEAALDTDRDGVILKADTIGSLEASRALLRQEGIQIHRASIGQITKKDLADAETQTDPLHRVVLGFNVEKVGSGVVQQITHQVIYKIIEEYKEWKQKKQRSLEAKELEGMTRPCRMKIMRGCVFRQSNPAVFGVFVEAGKLHTGMPLMKSDGSKCSEIKSIQVEGEQVSDLEEGKEAAVAVPHIMVGRQAKEEDVLYSEVSEQEFIKYKKLKKYLKASEVDVLKEIAEIKRKTNKFWGV